MANEKIITLDLLSQFKGLMETVIADGDKAAFKAFDFANNTIKIYHTEDKSDTPETISLPEEMFLDQAKTKFVNPFTWDEDTYPDSEDPDLDGKPVMVLAVKGDDSVEYSFVSLESLMVVCTGENTATANTSVSADSKISVDINVSSAEDNALVTNEDGLCVPLVYATEADIDDMFTSN